MTTLSEVMRAEHVVHVALLKIDVEGHEIEVVSLSVFLPALIATL